MVRQILRDRKWIRGGQGWQGWGSPGVCDCERFKEVLRGLQGHGWTGSSLTVVH